MRRLPQAVLLIVTLALFAISSVASAEELTGQQIVDKALEADTMGFQSGHAQMTLIVYDRAGERRERKLDVKSKSGEQAGRSLATLTHPPEVRGQSFLFVENKDKEDDVWMYVPAFKVTRRVEGSQKRGAFLGTHFTYADLETRDIKDSNYKRLKDETIGSTPVYVIEATPKNAAQSDYAKLVLYVRKDDHIPLRVRFFGKGGELDKTLFMEKLDKTESGATFARQMTLRSEKGGYTTIIVDALDTKADLPDSLFSREQLGK
ncbi:MAG: outer membrane lipoprotein-sorting protein [Bradymonadaceae bacterium]|nr:outer membrane lipoprotein-sorting protein [Lujinxingiaceae bacterium]